MDPREESQERGPDTGRGAAEHRPEVSPEDDLARRYLDLWERNLSWLALNGPVPGGSPRRR